MEGQVKSDEAVRRVRIASFVCNVSDTDSHFSIVTSASPRTALRRSSLDTLRSSLPVSKSSKRKTVSPAPLSFPAIALISTQHGKHATPTARTDSFPPCHSAAVFYTHLFLIPVLPSRLVSLLKECLECSMHEAQS